MNEINDTKWANKALELDNAGIITADGFANDLTKSDSAWAKKMLVIDDAETVSADGFSFVSAELKKTIS